MSATRRAVDTNSILGPENHVAAEIEHSSIKSARLKMCSIVIRRQCHPKGHENWNLSRVEDRTTRPLPFHPFGGSVKWVSVAFLADRLNFQG
eukprot:5627052-Amphidinium_carterae.1